MERGSYKKVLSGGGLIFDRGLEKFQKSQRGEGGGGAWQEMGGEKIEERCCDPQRIYDHT